jgi:hypothetical protein
MLRPAALAAALLSLALPAFACGPAPHPGPAVGRAAACADAVLTGEWIGDDGKRLRMLALGDGGRHWRAVYVDADGQPGAEVYSDVRRAQGCRYFARRHAELNDRVHPAPPHSVMLTLDPAAGRLVDDYRFGERLGWSRAATK